jgi:hypothetical protein
VCASKNRLRGIHAAIIAKKQVLRLIRFNKKDALFAYYGDSIGKMAKRRRLREKYLQEVGFMLGLKQRIMQKEPS